MRIIHRLTIAPLDQARGCLATNMLVLWALALQFCSVPTSAIPNPIGVSQATNKADLVAGVERKIVEVVKGLNEKMAEHERRTANMLTEKVSELDQKIVAQEEKCEHETRSMFEKFTAEMLQKLQEQETQIAEQERRIGEQDSKIAEQDERIAGQSETIAEQDSRMDRLESKNTERDMRIVGQQESIVKHEESTPQETMPTTPQDSLLFITGGWNSSSNSRLSSTETYPRSSNCFPPSLPLGRHGHTTLVTSEPTALVATCGGSVEGGGGFYAAFGGGDTASCLVLDPIKQRWDERRMGNLTMARFFGVAATLDHIGVFIVGGGRSNNTRTSEFLAAGTMQWQEGPALPVAMFYPCAVTISPTSFLSIFGTHHTIHQGEPYIREFDAAIAGPTSIEGWRETGRWPALKTIRTHQPGCAKIGQKVIIAGGRWNNGRALSSTDVLDLVNRQITSGGEMATPRTFFHIATTISGGEEKMFALAGWDGSNDLSTVEEWVEESSTWKAADNLVEKRTKHVVSAPRHLVCPL